jgi:threonine/homoserine/homoserine lactone efflux protein
VLTAFVFGLALALAIGPISLLILHFGVTGGARAGVLAALGSTLADFAYAVTAFSAGTMLAPVLLEYQRPLRLAAGLALLLIGIGIVRGGVSVLRSGTAPTHAGVLDGHPFLIALTLTSLNPMTILGFAAFATRLPPTSSWLDGIAHATAVVAGTFLVASGIGVAGGLVARWITTPRVLGTVNIVAGILIIGFAGTTALG